MPPQTIVASFVLRFVQEATEVTDKLPQANWHGVIKHIQTDEEQHFTRLADAIVFMARYVKLDESSLRGDAGA
jgi:hypothetical protein